MYNYKVNEVGFWNIGRRKNKPKNPAKSANIHKIQASVNKLTGY